MRLALFSIALCATAQTKPDFSGNWSINLAASDYTDARANKPEKLTCSIQQKGDHFKYRVENVAKGKKYVYDVDATVGGDPYESDAAGVVSLEWKEAALVINTVFNPGQDRQSDQAQTWTLSSDGKRLTDDLVVHLPRNRGSVHIVRVFDNQVSDK